jgi:hypothetical protein
VFLPISKVTPIHFHALMLFYYLVSFKGTMLSPYIHFLTKNKKFFLKEFKSHLYASDVFFLCCMYLFYILEEVTVAYIFYRNI